MPTLASAKLEPLDPSEPIKSISSGVFADISELDDLPVTIKLEEEEQSWPGSPDIESTGLRVASPPSSTSHSEMMNPCKNEPATDTAEAKRARRSAIEKKSRQRRKNLMNHMREEVKQLEKVGSQKGFDNSVDAPFTGELHRKYSELTIVAHALKADRVTLQTLLREHECYNRVVRFLLKERRAEDAFALWDSGVPPSSSFSVKFHHISIADGLEFARKTFEEVQEFMQCDVFESTKSNFMGWCDKRKYNGNTRSLLFSFTKQFPLEKAERLFTKTWDAYLDGYQLEKMIFDSSARTRFEVLQVLNDDLFVVRRDYRGPRFPVTLTSVQVMFRLKTPTGYAICLRTVSSPEIESALEPHELLFDAYHWMHFKHLYDGYDNHAGCEVVYGGCFDDQDPLRTSYWLFEMVCSVLRWENSTIAPLFLLQS